MRLRQEYEVALLEVAHHPRFRMRLGEAWPRTEVALEVAQCVRLAPSSVRLRRGVRWLS
jgi:hypothetical protein